MDIETRNFDLSTQFELRAAEGPAPGSVSGYAAVFDKLSEDLGGFRERIAPYAFDGITNGADIRIFWNHDSSMPLGRTRSGTARVAPDTQGLHFEVELPATSYARDLWASLERGDVTGASIGFEVAADGDKWSTDEAGNAVRTITGVRRLWEASIVSIPAYPDTAVATKRMQQHDSVVARQLAEMEAESRKRRLYLIGA